MPNASTIIARTKADAKGRNIKVEYPGSVLYSNPYAGLSCSPQPWSPVSYKENCKLPAPAPIIPIFANHIVFGIGGGTLYNKSWSPSPTTSLLYMTMSGGGGSGQSSGAKGGAGAYVSGYLSIIPGELLFVYAGGLYDTSAGGGDTYTSGAGGECAVVYTQTSGKLVVAGGGGGAGSQQGGAGGLVGTAGLSSNSGQGGSSNAGGAGGPGASAGSQISIPPTNGTSGGNCQLIEGQPAGGGGNGWYGGGGGSAPGGDGGGGSSYIDNLQNAVCTTGGGLSFATLADYLPYSTITIYY